MTLSGAAANAVDRAVNLARGYATIVNADPMTGLPALLGEVAPEAWTLTAFDRPWRQVNTVALSTLQHARPDLHQLLVSHLPVRIAPTRFLARFDESGVTVEQEAPLSLAPAASLRYHHALLRAGTIDHRGFLQAIPESALAPRGKQLDPRSRAHLQAFAPATVISGSSFTGVLVGAGDPGIHVQDPRVVLVDRIEAEHTALLHDPGCAGVLALRGSAADHFALIASEHNVAYAVVRDAHRTGAGLYCGGRAIPFGTAVTLDAEERQLLLGAGELIETSSEPAVHAARRLVLGSPAPVDIRLNIDTAEDAEDDAMRGASGVGLLRTEHMLRRGGGDHLLRAFIDGDAALRREALSSFQRFFRDQLVRCLRAAGDKPVAVRLLDYPLHELGASSVKEVNPMLGLRGVRQGIRWPPVYLAQLDGLLAAAGAVRCAGMPEPRLEILVPLVNSAREVLAIREMLAAVKDRHPEHRDLRVAVGAMIETPGAALAAADLARVCEFLSFGTNDLTQLTLGLSRDDYLPILHSYRQAHLLTDDPYTRLDPIILQFLHEAALAARRARPAITLGVCGVHADDPRVLRLCSEGVLDYVSVPRNRFVVTKLRATRLGAPRSRWEAEA